MRHDSGDWRHVGFAGELAARGDGIPFEIAAVARSYADALLAEGDLDAAAVEVGRVTLVRPGFSIARYSKRACTGDRTQRSAPGRRSPRPRAGRRTADPAGRIVGAEFYTRAAKQ